MTPQTKSRDGERFWRDLLTIVDDFTANEPLPSGFLYSGLNGTVVSYLMV